MSLVSRVPYSSSSSPCSPPRKAWATPVPAGRDTTLPARTAISSSPKSRVPSPPSTIISSSSAEWQWGGQLSFPGVTSTCRRPVVTDPASAPRRLTFRPTVSR